MPHAPPPVIPSGHLKHLRPDELIPSRNNPRHLFDKLPLDELKKNIRDHGVLVPITVFQPKGQTRYSILDGERRHRCCEELEQEGLKITIPANVVDPPTKIAGLLYMFSIHNFREQWDLMPTALALQTVMKELGEDAEGTLSRLTGLSESQIARCKKLLTFPARFQKLSLDPDPKSRFPSNFWIEAYPVLDLCDAELPDLVKKYDRDGLTDRLVEKYRAKRIKSVIHFRRIMEAYETAEGDPQRKAVLQRLRKYFEDVELETRKAFDEFVVDSRRIQSAIGACDEFLRQLKRLKLDFTIDREEIREALQEVREFTAKLLEKLEGSDAPERDED